MDRSFQQLIRQTFLFASDLNDECWNDVCWAYHETCSLAHHEIPRIAQPTVTRTIILIAESVRCIARVEMRAAVAELLYRQVLSELNRDNDGLSERA